MDNPYEDPWHNDDELGIHTEVAVRKSRVYAKLDDQRLLGEKGLGALKHMCEKVTLKGRGHELGDLGRLLDIYQMWSHQLFPKGRFQDLYPSTSKAGRAAPVRNLRAAWIDEERISKNATELGGAEDELMEIGDARNVGRHYDSEPRYSREQSTPSDPSRDKSADAPSFSRPTVDNPDDLFVGMESIEHRIVSDEDMAQAVETSRIEGDSDDNLDVSDLLEGARAQREQDKSRRESGRQSLFDVGGANGDKNKDILGGLGNDIFGHGELSAPSSKEPSMSPSKSTSLPNPSSQAVSTQQQHAPGVFDDLDLDFDEDGPEPDFEDQDQQQAEDDDDEDELAVMREMGM